MLIPTHAENHLHPYRSHEYKNLTSAPQAKALVSHSSRRSEFNLPIGSQIEFIDRFTVVIYLNLRFQPIIEFED